MQSVIVTDSQFIVDSNANFDWLKTSAKETFESLGDDIKVCVVSLGLNDLDKAESYASFMNKWAKDSQDIQFVFVNIGAIDESQCTYATNNKIKDFNIVIGSKLSKNWKVIDLYQYVEENNIQATDGVNYSIGDLANIFSWLVSSVSSQEKGN
jgi:hypothetical protein